MQVRKTHNLEGKEGEGEEEETRVTAAFSPSSSQLTFMNWSNDFEASELPLNRVRGFATHTKIKNERHWPDTRSGDRDVLVR